MVEHWSSEPKVAGSSPVSVRCYLFVIIFYCYPLHQITFCSLLIHAFAKERRQKEAIFFSRLDRLISNLLRTNAFRHFNIKQKTYKRVLSTKINRRHEQVLGHCWSCTKNLSWSCDDWKDCSQKDTFNDIWNYILWSK